jgi:hypothetical protein
MSNRVGVLLLAVAAAAAAGCTVELETQSEASGICEAARVGGVLAWDPAVGIGFRDSNGAVIRVVWPHGWTARMEIGGVVLFGEDGREIAREGQQIAMAGARGDDAIYPCAGPSVE